MAQFEQGYLIVQDALHYAERDVTSTVASLPELAQIPGGERRVRRILIHNIGAKIRWIGVAGVNPTGTFGDILDADDILVYDGAPSSINFVLDATATGNSRLHVHYFGA